MLVARIAVLSLIAAALSACTNGDAPALTDGSRFAFVPSSSEPSVVAVDALEGRVVAVMELSEPASAVVASNELDLLVAAHRESETATVIDLRDRDVVAHLELEMRPDTVLANVSDRFVTFGSADGTVSVWDLTGREEVLRVGGLSQATLLTYSVDGTRLFIVEPSRKTISVIGVAEREVIQEIPLGGDEDPEASVSALSRSVDGFTGYVSIGSEDRMVVVDLAQMKIRESVPVGRMPLRPYSTADNIYVLVPNAEDESLTVYAPREGRVVATVPVGIVPRSVNSGWLDTVAMVMPAEVDEIAVVDLQSFSLVTAIPLPGRSDDGIVTSDSKTLVTAIVDTGEVAIVDARQRTLVHVLATGAAALEGVSIALSNNVCH